MKKYKLIEDFKRDYGELRIMDRILFNIVLISIPLFFIGLFFNIEIFEIVGASFGISFSLLLLISYHISKTKKSFDCKHVDNKID